MYRYHGRCALTFVALCVTPNAHPPWCVVRSRRNFTRPFPLPSCCDFVDGADGWARARRPVAENHDVVREARRKRQERRDQAQTRRVHHGVHRQPVLVHRRGAYSLPCGIASWWGKQSRPPWSPRESRFWFLRLIPRRYRDVCASRLSAGGRCRFRSLILVSPICTRQELPGRSRILRGAPMAGRVPLGARLIPWSPVCGFAVCLLCRSSSLLGVQAVAGGGLCPKGLIAGILHIKFGMIFFGGL